MTYLETGPGCVGLLARLFIRDKIPADCAREEAMAAICNGEQKFSVAPLITDKIDGRPCRAIICSHDPGRYYRLSQEKNTAFVVGSNGKENQSHTFLWEIVTTAPAPVLVITAAGDSSSLFHFAYGVDGRRQPAGSTGGKADHFGGQIADQSLFPKRIDFPDTVRNLMQLETYDFDPEVDLTSPKKEIAAGQRVLREMRRARGILTPLATRNSHGILAVRGAGKNNGRFFCLSPSGYDIAMLADPNDCCNVVTLWQLVKIHEGPVLMLAAQTARSRGNFSQIEYWEYQDGRKRQVCGIPTDLPEEMRGVWFSGDLPERLNFEETAGNLLKLAIMRVTACLPQDIVALH